MVSTKKKVYLAGRVNGPKYEIVDSLRNKAEFISSDGGNHSEHNLGGAYYDIHTCVSEYREWVEEHAIEYIKNCDFLIAVVTDQKAYGTIAEIAYASALGKKCYIIIRREDNIGDETYQDAYWFISCFPNVSLKIVYCDCMATREIDKILTWR
jgi:nucleoside 2-deoxyribosyltransferase